MHRKPVAYSITGAPKSRTDDVRTREIRYLISMGIRTACFILAFITHGVLRWVLIVAAVLLPYIAVVIANAGRERTRNALAPYVPEGRKQLPAGPEKPLAEPETGPIGPSNQGRSSGEDLSSPH